jgi:hypothetical protein
LIRFSVDLRTQTQRTSGETYVKSVVRDFKKLEHTTLNGRVETTYEPINFDLDSKNADYTEAEYARVMNAFAYPCEIMMMTISIAAVSITGSVGLSCRMLMKDVTVMRSERGRVSRVIGDDEVADDDVAQITDGLKSTTIGDEDD